MMREPASALASAKMVRYLPKMPTMMAAEANSLKRRIIEQIFDALPMVETNVAIVRIATVCGWFVKMTL